MNYNKAHALQMDGHMHVRDGCVGKYNNGQIQKSVMQASTNTKLLNEGTDGRINASADMMGWMGRMDIAYL